MRKTVRPAERPPLAVSIGPLSENLLMGRLFSSQRECDHNLRSPVSTSGSDEGIAMTIHDTIAGSPGARLYPHVFSPLTLRGRVIPNRIVSTPHATGWGHDGILTQAEVDYHVRKAAGGVGLVMTFGSAAVDPNSAASYGSISLWDERNDDALRELAGRVHEHGALIMSQMTHMGRRGNSFLSGKAMKAVSDLPEGVHREVPAVLSEEEISDLIGRFGHAAQRLMNLRLGRR